MLEKSLVTFVFKNEIELNLEGDMLYLKGIFDAFFTTDKMFRQFARMRNLHQILTFYVMCLYVLLNDDNDNGKSIDTNEIH